MQASEISVRRAVPGDAAAIVRLIRRCYGDTYCVPAGVDPDRVRAAIREEREVFAVAVEPGGDVLGQAALVRRGAGVFECARVVIDQAGRSRGLMQRLTAFLFGEEARRVGARLLTAGAVTNHLHAQRNGRAFAMTPLGLLLGVYPEFTAMAGFGRAQQPVSTVIYGLWVGGRASVRRPRLAGADRRRATAAFEGLGLVCRPRPPGRSSGPRSGGAQALGCELVRDEAIGLLHLRYGAGRPADPSEPLVLAEPELLGGRLLWADVPLDVPGAQAQIDRLRRAGLGYGAVLPVSGLGGEDVLRLQRVLDPAPLVPEGIEVLDELRGLRDDVSRECLRPQLVAVGMSTLPLKRLRLELDQDLRGRWFFARAVRGTLSAPEYVDLLAQLEGLTRIAGGEEAQHLERLRAQDVSRLLLGLEEPAPGTPDLPLCPSLEYLAWLVQHDAWPRAEVSLQVALAILGTSWASDAAGALVERFQGSGAFLEELALAGPRASSALEQPLDALLADPQPIHAVTELVRGAFLGLATYLDSTWRTPVVLTGAAHKERLQ